MLELLDLKQNVPKEVYRQAFPELEVRLGECQRAARAAGVPVVLVFEGWDAAGKGSTINRLAQVLDPRGFQVYPICAPDETERLRPWMWRFWRALPASGNIAIFDRSWYGRVLVERMEGLVDQQIWERAYEEILQFERQLADAGAVIVKFWLHISKREQRRRFKRLEKNPATAWKVGKAEWRRHRQYGRWRMAVEEMLQRTHTAHAPWVVVEATKGRYLRTKVFESIIQAIEEELARRRRAPKPESAPMSLPTNTAAARSNILAGVDLRRSLERGEYEARLKRLQQRLCQLEHKLYAARVPAVIVFQGSDAAGKGGIIKRLTRGLDPRGYEVIPVGPPTEEEKAHHFLWRFWRRLPKAGHITIFDRSWYGRVLVERVEGFCTEDEWRRAYQEINEFERQLADFGTVIVKFWVHIDQDEQLRRFRAREETPSKQWKITPEDWRNREKWAQYEVAVNDMLRRTSTPCAPWTILEANCKLYARIKALRTVVRALQRALNQR